MKEFKGTKGPWSISEGWIDKHVSIDAEGHGAIALVLSDMESDYTYSETKRASKRAELSANAKLVAAAPDLLEALQKMFRAGQKQNWNERYESEMNATRAAISKALGEE